VLIQPKTKEGGGGIKEISKKKRKGHGQHHKGGHGETRLTRRDGEFLENYPPSICQDTQRSFV